MTTENAAYILSRVVTFALFLGTWWLCDWLQHRMYG